MKSKSNITTKHVGDAGEYYALSQFIFNGIPGAKMPDNWPGYDLAIESKGVLLKISIKTRVSAAKEFRTEHCKFKESDNFDYIVFIFKSNTITECWVIPKTAAVAAGKSERSSNENYRRISYQQLCQDFSAYKENWTLN